MKTRLLASATCLILALTTGGAAAADADLPGPWRTAAPKDRLAAVRVAQIDALRHLVERVYGHQVEGKTLVYNLALKSDRVKNAVKANLSGATQVGPPRYTADGIVYVTYAVKLRQVYDSLGQTETDADTGADVKVKRTHQEDKLIKATGNGALPGSKGMQMILARRAAELDAFRAMAKRIAGVQIDGTSNIRQLMLTDDSVNAGVCAFLKGLKPVDVAYADDGSCTVKLQLKIRETVRVMETLTKPDGDDNKVVATDTQVNDRVFTALGKGTPPDPDDDETVIESADMLDAPYGAERRVLQELLQEEVIVE